MKQKFLHYNSLGLIPGPLESETEFSKRAEFCLRMKSLPSFSLKDIGNEEIMSFSLEKVVNYFDIRPDWVPIFFSNYQISPWHGGCTWIVEDDEDKPPYSFLQLRLRYKNSKNFLNMYTRDELITHELVHVGRMSFLEPKFEEFFAYMTSPSTFRRIFGPFLQSAKESYILMGTLLAVSISQFIFPSLLLLLFPIILLFFYFGRLALRHTQLSRCRRSLNSICKSSATMSVLYRLTDEEICDFGRMSPEELNAYRQNRTCLRWQIINAAYFY